MKAIKVYGLFLLIMTMMPGQVFAHALWEPGTTTPPRSTDLFANLKVGPCGGNSSGGLARGIKPKIFKPGEIINVQWIETVDHEGNFHINLLDGNNKIIKNIIKDFSDSNAPAGTGTQYRNLNITIPTTDNNGKLIPIPCIDCSLQLLQEMWFGTPPMRAVDYNPVNYLPAGTFYFSCSDIRIESTSNTAPAEIKLSTIQPRINNIDNVVLNWVNPSEIQNNINNVAYRVLVLKGTAPINTNPVNGTTYAVDQTIGTTKVVYIGNLETATISRLTNTDKLYFKIFTYNVSNLYSAGVSSNGISVLPVAPNVTLSLSQGLNTATDVVLDGTNFVITANVTDDNINDTHVYSWSSKNGILVDSDTKNNTFTVDGSKITSLPNNTTDTLSVTVTDSSNLTGSSSINITLKTNPPPLKVGNNVINNIADNGGCSLSKSAKFDPLLLLLTLLSIIILFRKKKQD